MTRHYLNETASKEELNVYGKWNDYRVKFALQSELHGDCCCNSSKDQWDNVSEILMKPTNEWKGSFCGNCLEDNETQNRLGKERRIDEHWQKFYCKVTLDDYFLFSVSYDWSERKLRWVLVNALIEEELDWCGEDELTFKQLSS